MKIEHLENIFQDQNETLTKFHQECREIVMILAQTMTECLLDGGKLLIFGNGGSAADAQHVAAEIVGRFARERRALPAIALTTDTSILTAIGNDYGFERIFERQVQALAGEKDIVIGISTSGKSPSILRALQYARDHNIMTIGFTGKDGGEMPPLCDICFMAPSGITARIQEIHIMTWHAVCSLIEDEIIARESNPKAE